MLLHDGNGIHWPEEVTRKEATDLLANGYDGAGTTIILQIQKRETVYISASEKGDFVAWREFCRIHPLLQRATTPHAAIAAAYRIART